MGRTTGLGRIATFAVSAMMVAFSFGGVASAATITNTGPDSLNKIKEKFTNKCTVKNNNDIDVNNRNYQNGYSGDARVGGGGAIWSGWSDLDPLLAQQNGLGHDTWWNDVVGWMGDRGVADWGGLGDHLDWAPAGDSWSNYDPVLWQNNGQSFDNWWNGTQSYLDRNNPTWLLGWPGGLGGNTEGGSAITGDVSNLNSSNFAIRVNNAASNAAGTDACGRSLFVAPPRAATVCCLVPSRVATPAIVTPPALTPGVPGAPGAPVIGGLGAGFGVGAPRVGAPGAPGAPGVAAPGAVVPPFSSAAVCECFDVFRPGFARVAAPFAAPAVISNTGPHSSNVIDTKVTNEVEIKNNNDINVNNTNKQTGSSGDATVSNNNVGGDAVTGDVENLNETTVVVEVEN